MKRWSKEDDQMDAINVAEFVEKRYDVVINTQFVTDKQLTSSQYK